MEKQRDRRTGEGGSATPDPAPEAAPATQEGQALEPHHSGFSAVREKPGSPVYADYIALQVAREDQRKSSLEARGVMVVTTSGVLATILLGLATLTKKQDAAFALPDSARWWIIAALVCLALAVVGALVTNFPLRSDEADVGGLRRLIDQFWDDPGSEAEKTVAKNRVSIIKSAKKANRLRARSLFAAMCFELLALVAIAVAVGVSL